MHDTLTIGARVVVSWTGEHRIGYVAGNVFAGIVRGTSYVPVRFVDSGQTVPDVDVRVIELAPYVSAGCVGFADCPCHRCAATRVGHTAAHPEHPHDSDRSYCGVCRTAELERYRVPGR